MQAMLQMTKIDINKLQQAAAEAKSSATTKSLRKAISLCLKLKTEN